MNFDISVMLTYTFYIFHIHSFQSKNKGDNQKLSTLEIPITFSFTSSFYTKALDLPV